MANEKHLDILQQGVETWNKWRRENPNVRPDLNEVDLAFADLRGANLRKTFLFGADLSRSDLKGADLSRSDLSFTNLRRANLEDVELAFAHLGGANLDDANLASAHLEKANLRGVEYNSYTRWPPGFEPPPREITLTLNSDFYTRLSSGFYPNVARATEEPIRNLREAIDAIEDEEARKKLQQQLEEYEKIAEEAASVEQKRIERELELKLSRVEQEAQLIYEREISEIRDEARQRRLNTFLDKELWAVALGAILLTALAVFIGIMTVQGRAEVRILENAFLILLGFFFSQSIAARRSGEMRNNDSQESRTIRN